MDTTDPEIIFDQAGVCNHCTNALRRLEESYFPDETGEAKLSFILDKIRKDGKNKPYDCLIGISGGIDSSWLTYKSKNWGLKPLVFHVDAGWNSEIAQKNIESLLKKLDYSLYTYVVDWEEMRDLQRAYLESGLANQDVPQDHIFFAVLFKKAAEMGIKYWLSGTNLVSESILPRSWGYYAMDSKQLKAIHNKFGKIRLKTYKTLGFFEFAKYYSDIHFINTVRAITPLNLINYSINSARETLINEIDWKNYGKKHSESIFTKFFQNYYLPEKFGYDKRKAHLSSLIVAGEITREFAINQLKEPLYQPDELRNDKEFILKKLGYTDTEWDRIMAIQNKSFSNYPNWNFYINFGRKIRIIMRKLGFAG
jgi:N-acetyl sugar amidotransferase